MAKVCFGHLKRARSARALRLALQDPSLEEDAQVAVLAIELGMIAEAEALYKKCGRFDLLNRLYQASAKYEEVWNIEGWGREQEERESECGEECN